VISKEGITVINMQKKKEAGDNNHQEGDTRVRRRAESSLVTTANLMKAAPISASTRHKPKKKRKYKLFFI